MVQEQIEIQELVGTDNAASGVETVESNLKGTAGFGERFGSRAVIGAGDSGLPCQGQPHP